MTKLLKFPWKKQPTKGQSLVELAIFFPIILMMLAGLIEFGFLLNQYLNLMDGPREGARFGVDISPFLDPTDNDDVVFYTNTDPLHPGVSEIVQQAIVPYVLDPATDDVVISVVSISEGSIFHRYPDDVAITTIPGQFSLYGNHSSKLTDAQINAKLIGAAPKSGAVVVEMFYAYRQALALPWITIFVPDPAELHMFSVAPLPAAVPPATPTPIP